MAKIHLGQSVLPLDGLQIVSVLIATAALTIDTTLVAPVETPPVTAIVATAVAASHYF